MATAGGEAEDSAPKMGPALPAELARQLDDDDFYRLYKENGIQRSHKALSEDNWEEELEQIPLFMTKQPTQEQIDKSEDLQMMQAMLQSESTPESRAESAKDAGNTIFVAAKKMPKGTHRKVLRIEYEKALKLYDEGLAEKCKNDKLNAVLLTNKAAVNLLLGNKRRVINDCEAAVALDEKNVKAYWRACTACMQLDHYADAITWADRGLRVDPTNKTLSADRQKAVKLKAAIDKKARKRAAEIRKKEKKDEELLTAFKTRGIKFQKPLEVEMDISRKGIAAAGGEVYVDEQELLHWPVTFLYPEHQQTDFIKDMCEGHCFEDHLAHMFGPTENIPWDVDSKYKADSLAVYFETQAAKAYQKTRLVRVDPRLTLLEAVRDPRYTVVDLTPAFFVLVEGSPFHKQFLGTFNYSGDQVDTSGLTS